MYVDEYLYINIYIHVYQNRSLEGRTAAVSSASPPPTGSHPATCLQSRQIFKRKES